MTFMHDFANEKLPVSFKDVYYKNYLRKSLCFSGKVS